MEKPDGTPLMTAGARIKPPVCMATAPAGAAGGSLPASIAAARRTVCGPEHDWTLQGLAAALPLDLAAAQAVDNIARIPAAGLAGRDLGFSPVVAEDRDPLSARAHQGLCDDRYEVLLYN